MRQNVCANISLEFLFVCIKSFYIKSLWQKAELYRQTDQFSTELTWQNKIGNHQTVRVSLSLSGEKYPGKSVLESKEEWEEGAGDTSNVIERIYKSALSGRDDNRILPKICAAGAGSGRCLSHLMDYSPTWASREDLLLCLRGWGYSPTLQIGPAAVNIEQSSVFCQFYTINIFFLSLLLSLGAPVAFPGFKLP